MNGNDPNRRRLLAIGLVVIALVAAGVLGFVAMDYLADAPTASCANPPTTFGQKTDLFNHFEVAVQFTCEGKRQAGTLYLPSSPGPYPIAVWVHGAGPEPRLRFGDLLRSLADAGIAVFSYDKRGVGESEGSCCPGDDGHFNLLAADVVGAIDALATRSDLRKDEIGLIGASQAGWVAAKAATMSGKVAFIALASATPLTERTANLYERLAGGAEGQLSKEEISRRLESVRSSGFDPLPYLRQLNVPSLWMLGTADDRIPVPESVAVLEQLKKEGKDITIATFADAGHGLLDTPPTASEAPLTFVSWIVKHLH